MLELKNQDPGIGIVSYPETGLQQVNFFLRSNEKFFFCIFYNWKTKSRSSQLDLQILFKLIMISI